MENIEEEMQRESHNFQKLRELLKEENTIFIYLKGKEQAIQRALAAGNHEEAKKLEEEEIKELEMLEKLEKQVDELADKMGEEHGIRSSRKAFRERFKKEKA